LFQSFSFLGKPVGTIFVVDHVNSEKVKTGKYEIGWHLDPSAWGQGFATEAAQTLIPIARERGLTCLHAVVYPENLKSLAVCQRLGMVNRGLTSEWYNTSLVELLLEL
jgi:RimJ/RimL family protein N-acetyltransferase